MRTQDYIASLVSECDRAYARAVLAYIRERTDSQPWHPDYGVASKRAETIRRRIGTLAL